MHICPIADPFQPPTVTRLRIVGEGEIHELVKIDAAELERVFRCILKPLIVILSKVSVLVEVNIHPAET